MNYKVYLLSLLLACATSIQYSFADSGLISIHSPNIASMGVYGETPVSFYTGTPNISIPLYTINTNGYEIPISLSYHPASVMPDLHPGWVGLGWNLNAGGAIYRVVNHIYDECTKDGKGFLRNTDRREWENGQFISNMDYTKDYAPDEYSFSFMGYNGKFYTISDSECEVKCNKPVKVRMLGYATSLQNFAPMNNFIETNPSSIDYPIYGFEITTEDGTQYTFGCRENAIEYSIELMFPVHTTITDTNNLEKARWVANAWHLTKIVFPNGKTIDYSYDRVSLQAQLFNSIGNFNYYYYSNPGRSWWDFLNIFGFESSGSHQSSLQDQEYGNNGRLISPVCLHKIECDSLMVTFKHSVSNEMRVDSTKFQKLNEQHYRNYHAFPFLTFCSDINVSQQYKQINDLQFQKLDSIIITNKDKSLDRYFCFNYCNESDERLLLGSVGYGVDNAIESSYSFHYNNPGALPGYLSYKTDHWGYYNGITDDFDSYSDFINSRGTDSLKVLYGLLDKITYPTGGYSKYIFEPHDYSKVVKEDRSRGVDDAGENLIGGGVRIKEIIRSDSGSENDEFTYKRYTYRQSANPSLSSGVLANRFNYYINTSYTNDCTYFSFSRFSSSSILPTSSSDKGSNIGYTEVTEHNADNSFCVYKYSNYDTGVLDEDCVQASIEPMKIFGKYSSREEERGLLTERSMYGLNGNSTLQHDRYTYSKDSEDYILSYHINRLSKDQDYQAYKVYTYSMLQDSIINTVYENGDSITTLTKLEYNDHNQMIAKEVSRCGETIKDEYSYVTDIVGAYGNSISPYNSMYNLNMLLPVEHVHYRNNSPATAQLTTYKNDGHSFVPKAKYEQKVVNGSFSHYTGRDVSSAYGSPEIVFENYNDMSQPTMFMDRDSVYSAIIYKGIHPAMVVKNAHDMEILDDSHVTTNSERLDFYKCASQSTYTFSMNTDGEFNINLVPSESVTSWRITGTIDYQHPFTLLYNQSEGVGEPWDSYWGGNSFSVNLSAGVHQIIIREIETYPSFSSNEPHAYITYRYPELIPGTLKMCEAFYEDFDDEGNSNDGFLGTKCHTGSYTPDVCFRDSREYFIDYLIWENGSWKYRKEDFTGALSCSGRIDNVRIYPKDSQVMSYTFDDGIGMTSQTDGKGVITYYRYDKAGRLIEESDSFHGITNSYEYNYGH